MKIFISENKNYKDPYRLSSSNQVSSSSWLTIHLSKLNKSKQDFFKEINKTK